MPSLITNWKPNLMLLFTAAVWGFAFTAQRVGMEHVGPFTFNAVRFLLGSCVLIPVILLYRKKGKTNLKTLLLGGCLAATALFLGSSFQQVGLVYTTAGKAGFITGLYIVMVPLLGLFWRQRTSWGTLMGVILAVVGLYFLTMKPDFTIEYGDVLVLVSAFFWACQIQIVGWFSPKVDSVQLAFIEFFLCSLYSFMVALFIEDITIVSLQAAMIPILYAGIMKAGSLWQIRS
jgi:drug/metabolite transporter (DMT)-like permease